LREKELENLLSLLNSEVARVHVLTTEVISELRSEDGTLSFSFILLCHLNGTFKGSIQLSKSGWKSLLSLLETNNDFVIGEALTACLILASDTGKDAQFRGFIKYVKRVTKSLLQ
jgi:hypothetical protein